MAKILLIKASKQPERCTFPHIVSPPLGVMYLASALRNKGHQVKIVDMWLDYLDISGALKEFRKFRPDIVGVSSLNAEATLTHQLAKEIKKESSCKVVVGGPYATTSAESAFNDSNIDYLVLGEGEQTLPELVGAVSGGRDLSQIKGITFKANGNLIKTPPREFIQNLDELPFPSWDLIRIDEYGRYWRTSVLRSRRTYMPIITSRGCPYQCTFCHNLFGRRFRVRSAENVFSEIETLYNTHGIRDFEVMDDCFNLDKERALKICDLIISSGIKIGLCIPQGLRGDIVDKELLLKLRQAGTYQISYAVETGSLRLQKMIKKNIDLTKIEKVIAETAKLGIIVNGFFMIGFPTETRKDLRDTVRFALKSKFDTMSAFMVNPFPSTELYQMVKKSGKFRDIDFEDYSYWYSDINVSEVSDKELLSAQRNLYRRFYLDPKRIFRLALRFPTIRGLLSNFIVFLVKIFFSRNKRCHKWLSRLRPL
ncbi:cobalamin-dependent protein [Candidatus Pacearchaeota archaeon]|nr:cobalamin-dependent protein [Candidatus Pacearchaeota archaeon]